MKTALITGGTKGIGLAIALKMAKNNFNLILNYYQDDDNAYIVKNKIEKLYKNKVLLQKCDISKDNEVMKLLDNSLKFFGHIDILINNAGICNDTVLDDKNVEDFKRILDVNLVGPFLMCKYIGKYMLEKEQGIIINISSTNAIDTYYPESMDYDASKAGLNSLTMNFANIYAPYIRVNAIACGWVDTDMNKNMDLKYRKKEEEKILLKRFANADEIANVVYFLTTEEASYVNGSIVRVDGGIDKGV